MKTGWLRLIVAVVLAPALPARAQPDEPDEPIADVEEAPAAPEVAAAWATPEAETDQAATDQERESESFARIHDADAALPELEAAQRMVGYDLMDGVR